MSGKIHLITDDSGLTYCSEIGEYTTDIKDVTCLKCRCEYYMDMTQQVWTEMCEETKRETEQAIEYVKNHIDYDFSLLNLDELTYFEHVGFVEVELTDYKNCFYPSNAYYKEKGSDDDTYFMRQDEADFHTMIYQEAGICEDNYSGYQLFPLTNGLYWKISFNC